MTVIEPDRVLDAAMQAADAGAESFGIVNSGFGPSDDEVEQWGGTIQRIQQAGRTRACGSLGVLTAEQTQRLARFGMQRYNHNLQTSRRFFPNIISTHSYDERLATLRHLKNAGVSVCSGALFGMGETWADRLDLAFELRNLDVDVVPINFLIPIDGTPLAGSEPMDPMECLKIIAVYRFCLPGQEIKIAGGREKSLRDLQSWIFHAGADSFLIGNYLTTCGRPAEDDRRMVRDLGLELVEYHHASGNNGSVAVGKGPVRLPVATAGRRV
jgi:biotin synthase